MKLGKRTQRLVREAMVLGFAEGCAYAGFTYIDMDKYPKDSNVEERVFRTAQSYSDLYPLLSKVEK